MSKSSSKGYALERLIRDDLKLEGVDAYRPRAGNVNDEGDVKGVPGVTIEAKNWTTMALPQWWRETQVETENAGNEIGLLVHKRKGKGQADDQWVTVDWAMMKRLLRLAGLLPHLDNSA